MTPTFTAEGAEGAEKNKQRMRKEECRWGFNTLHLPAFRVSSFVSALLCVLRALGGESPGELA
jgi:hypothetical protein